MQKIGCGKMRSKRNNNISNIENLINKIPLDIPSFIHTLDCRTCQIKIEFNMSVTP